MARKKVPVSDRDTPELIGQIIDIFEDFLDNHGVSLRNHERDDDCCAAIIYGTDYSNLYDGIKSTLVNWEIISQTKGVE